ncbi:hypothetical protein FHL15_004984 [Xylaria flabelliformis]|uniref:Cytochrome P450 n=1 Tax=Xylaria flabelliformis TaxID=2512241 RepID=A0A553I1Y6_9PEZI|nr:hypothetical protein FHL15_004984 [Xylaria flabelliformis]
MSGGAETLKIIMSLMIGIENTVHLLHGRPKKPQFQVRLILDDFVSESLGQPLVINELVSWFTFDCMGDFGFGQDFGMMRERKWLEPILHMHASWSLLGVFSPAIWVPRISFAFFPIGKAQDWFKALAFSESLLKTCLERESGQADIVSEFIRDYQKSKRDQIDYSKLSGDASVLLFTGTDTTASSLIIVLYFLARFPSHVEKIQEELRTVDIRDVRALTSLPHLTGTINESMRLLPVALTTNPGSRVTPAEGLTVDGTFIPGGVKICTSRFVLGKLNSAYEEPESFIPERWYSRPELIKDRRAFAPFGIEAVLGYAAIEAHFSPRLVTIFEDEKGPELRQATAA